MTWLGWLAIAVIITSVAAVTGIKPKGSQHLAHTRMMTMARFALLAIAILLALAALVFRVRPHG